MLDSDPLVMRYVHEGHLRCDQAMGFAGAHVEVESIFSGPRWRGKWMIVIRGTLTRVGWIELSNFDEVPGSLNVGYEFAPRTGIVAMRLKHRRLYAYIRPENERSRRVLAKTGFVMRRATLLEGGENRCNIYQLTRRKWRDIRLQERLKQYGTDRRIIGHSERKGRESKTL